jgi:hypothetical protein
MLVVDAQAHLVLGPLPAAAHLDWRDREVFKGASQPALRRPVTWQTGQPGGAESPDD